LAQRAAEQIESADVLVSAMVMLELEMLYDNAIANNEAPLVTSDRKIHEP